MKRIRFLVDCEYSPDGKYTIAGEKGETGLVLESTAAGMVSGGLAEYIDEGQSDEASRSQPQPAAAEAAEQAEPDAAAEQADEPANSEAEPDAGQAEAEASGIAHDKPLTAIAGIGPVTAAEFASIGITNCGELVYACIEEATLGEVLALDNVDSEAQLSNWLDQIAPIE